MHQTASHVSLHILWNLLEVKQKLAVDPTSGHDMQSPAQVTNAVDEMASIVAC